MSNSKQTQDSSQSGTSASTGSTTSHSIMGIDVPDWLLQPAQALAGSLQGIMGQGPGAFTPTVGPLQKQGYDAASQIQVDPQYRDARGLLLNGKDVTGGSVLDNLNAYMSPFKQQVLDPAMADFDAQAGRTRAAQAAAGAQNRAFQGSRWGVQEGQTEGELARARAATEGGLLQGMFTQGTGLSESDLSRNLAAQQSNQQAQLQRAAQLANIKNSEQANVRANVGLLNDVGGTQTAQENAINQYPLQFQQQTEGFLQGLDPGQYFGKTMDTSGTSASNMVSSSTGHSTTESDPGLFATIGPMMQAAAMFSDRRLKRDIRTVGWDAKGHRLVSFSYLWEPLKRRLGVIAQEVAKITPEAVLCDPESGALLVNYGALGWAS